MVVPLFNKRGHVRQTILGVIGQDYDQFEVIVVDDGSSDGSVECLADLTGSKLRIVRQANAGPGAARNLGIGTARHEWIAFVDADDLWYPDHLAELAGAIMAHPSAGIASTAYVKRAKTPELPARPETRAELRLTDYFAACSRRNVVCASTVAVRRSVFDRVGAFSTVYPGEDTDMWVRAGLHVPLAISSRVTAIYTMDTGGLSDTHARHRRAGQSAVMPDARFLPLLRQALNDATFQPLHASIRTYLDARAFTVARNAIFEGDRMRARQALQRVIHRAGRRFLAYKMIAHAPGVVFAACHAAWRGGRAVARALSLKPRHRVVALGRPD